MSKLRDLAAHGQSVWFDYIRRDLVTSGELAELVSDGVRGLTSNPTIFEKAIAGSDLYDGDIKRALADDPGMTPAEMFERIAIADIRGAADVLRPVYEATDCADGYASLEVSPTLAADTAGTIADARRLWQLVDRPNLMIKIPATPEGIPAIEATIADDINVNVTLMFSLSHYEAVANAYVRGLEQASDPERIASVASFFVSRVDTVVDKALEEIGTADALGLRGAIAVSNSKLAYARYQELFGSAFDQLRERGGRPQRVLWASTSSKNPAYPDTIYVDELIGPNTVNTMPPQTVEAFRDHGTLDPTALTSGLGDAQDAISALDDLGIDLEAVAAQLQVDGVAVFAASYEDLLAAIAAKAAAL